jgi:hypothetical protein
VLFFIVPLFGVVIMGMLWKQATKPAGFWGLLLGTLSSIAMFLFAHWFPAGYTPVLTKDLKDIPAIVRQLEANSPQDPIADYVAAQLSPQTRDLLNEYTEAARRAQPPASILGKVAAAMREDPPLTQKVKIVLVDDFNRMLKDPKLCERFGAGQKPKDEKVLAAANRKLLNQAFPGALAPVRRLEATEINPSHAEIIATSPKAQDMAVNMWSAIWSLLITLGTVIMVSLFSTPKSDPELATLVYGLTPLPDEGWAPFYSKPTFWAAVVMAVLIAVNIYFW